MDVPDRHIRASQISAVTNRGEVRFMTYKENMTATVVGFGRRSFQDLIFTIQSILPAKSLGFQNQRPVDGWIWDLGLVFDAFAAPRIEEP